MKKEKEKVITRFLYSNGILKRIRVVSVEEAKELEYWWKQKQEIQIIEKSKARQRYRIQQLIGFSVIFDSMFKQQISHVGHRRYIHENCTFRVNATSTYPFCSLNFLTYFLHSLLNSFPLFSKFSN